MDSTSYYVVFGHYIAQPDKIQQLLESFKHLLDYARQNKDGFPCLYILKEDTEAVAEITTISCFKNKSAYQAFLSSTPFQNLTENCEKQSLLVSPHRDEVVSPATGYAFRSALESTQDPYVVIARILYAPGTREEGVKHWEIVTESVKKEEQETFSYLFMKSTEDMDILYSLERYKSKQFLWDVHVPSAAIANNIKNQREIRVPEGLKLRFWKEVGNSRTSN